MIRPGHTWLHLAEQLLVEETASLLVQRAVDSHNVTLPEHLLEAVHPAATNLLLHLWRERLVVEVQKLLAVKRLQSAQHTLANTDNSDGTDDLVLQIVLVLCDGGDVPVTTLDHLASWAKVADKSQDGHDDVFGDRDDIGAGDLSDGDAAVGLVCSVEVDMVGSDTSSNGNLELLRFRKALCGEVTRMEA